MMSVAWNTGSGEVASNSKSSGLISGPRSRRSRSSASSPSWGSGPSSSSRISPVETPSIQGVDGGRVLEQAGVGQADHRLEHQGHAEVAVALRAALIVARVQVGVGPDALEDERRDAARAAAGGAGDGAVLLDVASERPVVGEEVLAVPPNACARRRCRIGSRRREVTSQPTAPAGAAAATSVMTIATAIAMHARLEFGMEFPLRKLRGQGQCRSFPSLPLLPLRRRGGPLGRRPSTAPASQASLRRPKTPRTRGVGGKGPRGVLRSRRASGRA